MKTIQTANGTEFKSYWTELLSLVPYIFYEESNKLEIYTYVRTKWIIYIYIYNVMVIVVGNGHGDTSSNHGRDWLHFTLHLYPWERYESNYSPSSHIRIINLFPSCNGFWYKSKTPKNNWTSSDLMNKIIQNRHRKEGWEELEERWSIFSSFSPLPVLGVFSHLEL